MINNTVSIITPAFNASGYVTDTIKSVLNQTYTDYEMIVVDDCSTDNTCDLVSYYSTLDDRVKLIKLDKNMGQAIARNTAIKHASGRYIAFLDSDDMWKPHKLEKQIKFMQENNLALTYSSYDIIDEQNSIIGTFNTKPIITYQSMLKTCSIGCLTAIYDTHILGKMYMDTSFRRQEDYILWLSILKKIPNALGITEPLAYYRISSNTVSSNKFKAAISQWSVYRDVEKLGLVKSLYCFTSYAINGLLKYKIKR